MNRYKTVDEFISDHAQWQEELIRLQALIQQTELIEGIKWGFPCYTINNKNVVGLGAFKSYVGLWFYQGVYLSDPYGVLINAQEEKTKAMRQWRMNSIDEIDDVRVLEYLTEAIANQKAGKEMKATPKMVSPAPELLEGLAANHMAQAAFSSLTLGRQNEYHEYINDAKRAATKQSRVAKCLPIILSGKGLNDKYKK